MTVHWQVEHASLNADLQELIIDPKQPMERYDKQQPPRRRGGSDDDPLGQVSKSVQDAAAWLGMGRASAAAASSQDS
jgi:hypothetical protein